MCSGNAHPLTPSPLHLNEVFYLQVLPVFSFLYLLYVFDIGVIRLAAPTAAAAAGAPTTLLLAVFTLDAPL